MIIRGPISQTLSNLVKFLAYLLCLLMKSTSKLKKFRVSGLNVMSKLFIFQVQHAKTLLSAFSCGGEAFEFLDVPRHSCMGRNVELYPSIFLSNSILSIDLHIFNSHSTKSSHVDDHTVIHVFWLLEGSAS